MTRTLDHTITRTAMIMGLPFSLRIRGPIDAERLEPAIEQVWRRLHHYDRVFSPFRPDSDLAAYQRNAPQDAIDPEFFTVLDLADVAKRLTGGTFDVTAGGRLDPSGIVKGWAAERATEHLLDERVDFYLNAGGDLRLYCRPNGGPPWRVGIEHPGQPHTLISIVTLATGAVATSGAAHRGNHLINPATGIPVAAGWQATVIGPTLTWADILATTAAITGPSHLDQSGWPPGYQVMHSLADGTIYSAPNSEGVWGRQQ
jgi:FAD:protein FMN transferase